MTTLRSFRVQLAERIRPNQLEKYYADDDWVAQPKLDGVRLALVAEEGEVHGINRKGPTAVPHIDLVHALTPFANGRLVIDGEWVGGVLWVFDVPYALDKIDPSTPYATRAVAVEAIVGAIGADKIKRVLHYGGSAKRALVEAVETHSGEGVMLRNLNGQYLRGKRTRNLLKCKFTKEVDCIVIQMGREGKSSAAVGLIDNGKLVDVGSVTMSAHWMATLEAGDVIEVEYLYANDPNRPRLYQPVMKRKREDKPPLECTLDQLAYTDKTVRNY